MQQIVQDFPVFLSAGEKELETTASSKATMFIFMDYMRIEFYMYI